MLTCKDISNQASDHLERELSPRQRLAFALHLLLCGNCREFVRHLRSAVITFRGLPVQELDPAQAKALVETIAARAATENETR